MEPNTAATEPLPKRDPVQDNPTGKPDQDLTPKQDLSPNQNPNLPPNQDVRTPARPKGPNASAIVLGLVALALAALVIVTETTSLPVNWSVVGPGAIVGIGALLVVFGAVGLVRRHDDG